ncbi:MAG: hypothetical protein JWL71_1468 [Acidobacteria bacterium]|nr:hypothetical protein [Acidobacteriota bacterium]
MPLGVDGAAAGVELGVDDDDVVEELLLSLDVVLFSAFEDDEEDSVDAAGLSAFAALSDLPPSDFGADPLSPFG